MGEAGLYEQVVGSIPSGALPKARVRASAAVVPWRVGDGGDLEVFWVERSPDLAFMGGFHAFPGGGLSRSDTDLPVAGEPTGLGQARQDGAMPDAVLEGVELEPILADGIVGCVVRELFEETGLLLGRGAEPELIDYARQRLLSKEVSFGELVESGAWRLNASPLVYAGRWLTPAMGPVRFDNRFFLLEWPRSEPVQPEVCGGELIAGEWIEPCAALERWKVGKIMTAPPILHFLNVLAGSEAGDGFDLESDGSLARLREPREMNLGPHRRIEFRPGVLLFPLPTPTLPPASHTNTFVLGTSEAVVVDPGTPYPDQIDGLVKALRRLEGEGRTVSAIWLTHHHPDHVGGVEALRAALGVPVCAHRETAAKLGAVGITIDRELADGQRVVLAGDPPFPVRVIHTPGHAKGHLAFLDETHGSLLGGDLTAGIGTIVIDPPEGNLDDYLESLRLARALEARTLFPSHGPPTITVARKLDEYIAHRRWREQRVLDGWRTGLRGEDLLTVVYDDIPAVALPLAARQLRAHLESLARSGQIDLDG